LLRQIQIIIHKTAFIASTLEQFSMMVSALQAFEKEIYVTKQFIVKK